MDELNGLDTFWKILRQALDFQENKEQGSGQIFFAKKNGAKRTLLRRGAPSGTRTPDTLIKSGRNRVLVKTWENYFTLFFISQSRLK